MEKYINESYLLDALGVFCDRKNGNLHFLSGIKSAQEIIEYAPVEVTMLIGRCKECAYFSGEHCLKLWSETDMVYPNVPKIGPEDYCSKFKKFEISKITVENTCRLAIISYNSNCSDYERYKKMYGELSDRALECKRAANLIAKKYNDYVSNLNGAFEDGALDGIPEKLECL